MQRVSEWRVSLFQQRHFVKKKIEVKAKAEKNIESGIAIKHRFSDRTVREREREKSC